MGAEVLSPAFAVKKWPAGTGHKRQASVHNLPHVQFTPSFDYTGIKSVPT